MNESPETQPKPEAGQPLAPTAGYAVGDVFQINEKHGRNGWIGAFVMATEIKSWGIQGFVSHIETHDQQNRAYIRLKWEELDYIGHAQLIPGDETA